MRQCLNCGKETKNPKFCSQSCAAIYNNTHRPKVKRYCQRCGALIGEGQFCQRKYCDNCSSIKVDWSVITLDEVQNKATYQVSSRIRELARQITNGLNRFKRCAVCGYTKHVEICHIKPIKDFSGDTPITEINNLSNLVGLCPNHHWEFDNHLLDFDEEWLKDK